MNQKGFVNILIGVVIAIVVIGAAGYFFVVKKQSESPKQQENIDNTKSTPTPPVSEPKTEPVTPTQKPAQPPKASESEKPALSFLKPKGSISANSGETISIEMRGTGVSEVLLVGPEFAESKKSDGTGIFTFQYRVSSGATGAVKLQATGKTSGGSFVQSDELTINISLASACKVISMRVLEDDIILFGVGDTEQLRVYGKFSDGVERDITSTSLGTKYILYPGQPLNTEIIRVDGEGKVTAINSGQRSIVITHKGYSGNAISVTVRVQ